MARTGKTKKLFSILLAAVMALSVMPAISVNLQPKAQAAALNMTNCSNAASVTGNQNGGLIGYSESKVGETFIHCYNVGTVTTTGDGTARARG